jgi:broad specificity phosphatase PhoE
VNPVARRVWLVRHGSTDWTGRRWCGTTDLPLSREGRAEAEALAAELSTRVPFGTELVSSPLRRALETAASVAAVLGSPARVDGRLREVDFGEVEGLDWAGIEASVPAIAQALETGVRSIDWPGGESSAQVAARATEVWQEVEERGLDLVLVSHAGLMHALLQLATGTPYQLGIRPARAIELRWRPDLRHRDGAWAIAT